MEVLSYYTDACLEFVVLFMEVGVYNSPMGELVEDVEHQILDKNHEHYLEEECEWGRYVLHLYAEFYLEPTHIRIEVKEKETHHYIVEDLQLKRAFEVSNPFLFVFLPRPWVLIDLVLLEEWMLYVVDCPHNRVVDYYQN